MCMVFVNPIRKSRVKFQITEFWAFENCATVLKKRLRCNCFHVNFEKFSCFFYRTPQGKCFLIYLWNYWLKQPLELFCKKCVLRNFARFTGQHLCQSLFFNKVEGLRPASLFKKRLWHRCFPVNFAKFLRTPFLQNTSRQLLLNWSKLTITSRQCSSETLIRRLQLNLFNKNSKPM